MSSTHCPTIYFVSGTNTDVGKTYCASRIAEMLQASGRRVGVYKPVASGCETSGTGEVIASDAVELWNAAGRPLTLDLVCPQLFLAPLAPPEAARKEQRIVDEQLLFDGLRPWLNGPFDVILVEGAGGLFSPLSESLLNIDFVKQLETYVEQFRENVCGGQEKTECEGNRRSSIKTILVASNQLGVVHQVTATVRAAKAEGCPVSGVLLNQMAPCPDDSASQNQAQIEKWGETPVVVQIQSRGGGLQISDPSLDPWLFDH